MVNARRHDKPVATWCKSFMTVTLQDSGIRKEPEKYADLRTKVGTDFAHRTVENIDRSYFSSGPRSGTTVDGRRWTEDG
jgi:hypothetical protein